MILKEQLTPDELKKQGYTTDKPADYSPDKYDKQRANGLTWYKKKGSGGNNGNKPSPTPASTNLDDYVGTYKGNLGRVFISKRGDKLQAAVQISTLERTWGLTNASGDKFVFEKNSGTITFNRTGNTVSSLTFKYSSWSFDLTKESTNIPTTVWSCIQKSQEKHGITSKHYLKPGSNENEMIMKFDDGDTWTYYKDGTFKNIDDGKEVKGKWQCDGDSEFTIKSDTGWVYSSSKNVWESKEKQLSSLIKENLLEKKENKLIENNIVESRLKFVLGDKNIKNLSEDNQIKISFGTFEEIAILANQGLLNEATLLNTFKGIFGDNVNSLPETFYMPWVENVLKTLNMNDSYLKEYLVSRLTKEPKEVWNSFESCEKMSRMVAKALAETLIFHLKMDKDFTGLDDVKKTLEDTIREEQFVKKLDAKIRLIICHLFDKYSTGASNVLTKLKS